MNRNLYSLTLAIILMSAVSCNKSKEKDLPCIDLEANVDNWQQVNMSSFVSDIRYVVLERIPEYDFSYINKMDFSGKLGLLCNKRICLLYDLHGNFQTKIGNQGRGPGEYTYISNIEIGENGKIYIQSLYDLYVYSINGNFLYKEKDFFRLEDDYIYSWCLVNDSLIFGHVPNTTGQKENRAVLLNIDGTVTKYFRNTFFFNRQKETFSPDEGFACFNSFDCNLTYTDMYNDTIFALSEENKLTPIFLFNSGKYGEPKLYRDNEDIKANIISESRLNFIYHKNIFQSDNYLFIEFMFGHHFPVRRITPRNVMGRELWYHTRYILGVYDKKDKSLVLCKPTSTDNYLFTTGMYNDIDAGPRFFPSKQIDDSTMVMWVQAHMLKAHVASDDFKNMAPRYPEKKKEVEELANSLSDTDNPVLMIVRLRKDI